MNKKLKNFLKLLLKLVITSAALIYVFSKIDISNTWSTILKAKYLLLFFAALLFILSKIISSFRLNKYFKNIGIIISEKKNLQLYWLGMFYNLSLPGGIGGDGYKVYLLNKHFPVKAKKIFWAVFLDRVIGMLALFCLSIIVIYFIPEDFPFKSISFLAIIISITVSYYIFYKFFNNHSNIFISTNLQSLAVQILQGLCAWIIMVSIGINDKTMSYLLVFFVSSIVAAITPTIGGAGAREFTFFWGSQLLGLDMDVSVAISLLFYAITVVVSLWGIWYVVKPVDFSIKG